MLAVQIPASWVVGGFGVPDVCARHGELAVERKKVTLGSRPPGWSYPLLLAAVLPAGVMVFVIVFLVVRKTVTAPAWRFCARCRARHKQVRRTGFGVMGLGGVLLSGSAALIGASTLLGSLTDTTVVLGVLGLQFASAALVAGSLVAVQAQDPALAAAVVSPDGL